MDILKLWFTITEISPNAKIKLIERFENLENIRDYVLEEDRIVSKENNIVNKLKKTYDINILESMNRKIEAGEFELITIEDRDYPSKLKLINDSPYGFFYKGNIKKLNEECCVSIVGSRTCSRYGGDLTKIIAEELSANNINIISGLARGIDTIAHKTAIDNKGYTVAVLGSGIDVVYPRENKHLYNNIVENGGCIISEFSPGTKPLSMNFPIRNRIISGLSDLLVITEAGEKSGSLITATRALEQGKEVIAVPGSIFSEESKGTNKLIKEGAHVLTEIDDIFYLLGIHRNKKNKNINDNIKDSIYGDLNKLIDNNPIHIDDIIRLTNIDIKQLYGLLFEMQLREEILCLSGNFYVRINKAI